MPFNGIEAVIIDAIEKHDSGIERRAVRYVGMPTVGGVARFKKDQLLKEVELLKVYL